MINDAGDWERQKRIYYDCLLAARRALDELPEELRLLSSSNEMSGGVDNNDPFAAFQLKMGLRDDMLLSLDGPDASSDQRRARQREIQKANIYASGLSTLSHIVENFFSAREKQQKENSISQDEAIESLQTGNTHGAFDDGNGEVESEMNTERDSIVRNLLIVLSTIDRENMEPNGDSFAQKIRFIASTLIDIPRERKGTFALQAEDYLKAFLDILVRLERAKADADSWPARNEQGEDGINGNGDGGSGDEDIEARHWADLREYQNKFNQSGGVANLG